MACESSLKIGLFACSSVAANALGARREVPHTPQDAATADEDRLELGAWLMCTHDQGEVATVEDRCRPELEEEIARFETDLFGKAPGSCSDDLDPGGRRAHCCADRALERHVPGETDISLEKDQEVGDRLIPTKRDRLQLMIVPTTAVTRVDDRDTGVRAEAFERLVDHAVVGNNPPAQPPVGYCLFYQPLERRMAGVCEANATAFDGLEDLSRPVPDTQLLDPRECTPRTLAWYANDKAPPITHLHRSALAFGAFVGTKVARDGTHQSADSAATE
jgi:hypothetical protein